MKDDEKNLGADAAADAGAGSIAAPSATARHTEGPWHIDRIAAGPSWYVIGNDGEDIARVRGGEGHSKANAQLIAAAPELLTIAQHTLGMLRACRDQAPAEWDALVATAPGSWLPATWDDLKGAIAKAEGRS